MKVTDLKRIIDHCKPDDDVFVIVKMPFVTVGGTPVVSIKSAQIGFDWDKGLILTPEKNLSDADTDFEEKFKALQEKCGWLDYENRNLKSDIKKLKKEIAKMNTAQDIRDGIV